MEWLRWLLVLLLLGRAIYTDVKAGIIENQSMLWGLLCGCVWSMVNNGMSGLSNSLQMVLITILILFVLFLMKGLGAGDIKLLCVLAAFYPDGVLKIIVVAFFVGAVISLGKMVVRLICKMPVYISGETLHFSIAIGISTLLVNAL